MIPQCSGKAALKALGVVKLYIVFESLLSNSLYLSSNPHQLLPGLVQGAHACSLSSPLCWSLIHVVIITPY